MKTKKKRNPNPYQDSIEMLQDAAELLKASGELSPEHAVLQDIGVQRARLMVSLVLVELCG